MLQALLLLRMQIEDSAVGIEQSKTPVSGNEKLYHRCDSSLTEKNKMSELLFIAGIFTGLCVSLYFTIKLFPVSLDINDRLEKDESLATIQHSKL